MLLVHIIAAASCHLTTYQAQPPVLLPGATLPPKGKGEGRLTAAKVTFPPPKAAK